MKFGAVILAAGESSRMGSPKALLRWNGETFLDRLIALFATVASPVVVVLGFRADEVRRGLARGSEAAFAINPDPARGMLSSLQTGLAALPEGLDGFLFTTVDSPAVAPLTVKRLTGAIEAGAALAIPRWQGRNGHPVACAAGLAAEFLALDPGHSPKEVVRRHESETERVEVDDPGAIADIDTPEDYEDLLAAGAPAR